MPKIAGLGVSIGQRAAFLSAIVISVLGCGTRENSQPSSSSLGEGVSVPAPRVELGPGIRPSGPGDPSAATRSRELPPVGDVHSQQLGGTDLELERVPGSFPTSVTTAQTAESGDSVSREMADASGGGTTRVPQPVRPNPLRDGDLVAATGGLRDLPSIASEPQAASGTTPKSPGKGKRSGEPFDPIKENGPIFVGWPSPKFALVITGREDGYLEPCGCAGLDRMKGGLSRRFSMFRQLREEWKCPVVGLDVGGLIKGFGRQTELKFHLTVSAMQQMGYQAIALGVPELRLPAGELLAASLGDGESLFVSANVALFGFDQGFTPSYKIIDLPGVKLGVTAVLGTSWQEGINNPDVQIAPAVERLRTIVSQLEQEAEICVLLAHASWEESWKLGELFPQFDIVVTAGTPPEPPVEPTRFKDGRLFIEVGTKGMNAIVLGFYDVGQRVRYQRVPLDSRFPQAPEVTLMLAEYQQQLKELGLEGLGIRPAPNPKLIEMGNYVGSRKCQPCHEPSYEIWRKTGHAKAWRTLKELEIPRTHDPECISCHVIGWHPTEYFPYEGGFLSEEKTPHLVDVGCEACHGPGEKHVQAEMGSNVEAQEKYRRLVRVTLEDARQWQCVSCHDLDNSPDFEFDTYWPVVAHYED